MPNIRLKRAESELNKLFNNTLEYVINDPRLEFVTISAVKISKDFSYAKIYYTFFDDALDKNEIENLLTRASGIFKKELGSRHILRKIPELKFYYDKVEESAIKLEKILEKIDK